ncbi:Aste57867_19312 [Aphanomyces stellatus]|uniref:Aste57867_19312 protein n=1 Tax=Aphanomyces stellatus TaxID=120398 RepID=A0A485LCV5_9STRA|nr:hypothetical protein As57867_019248 [Aphanomyces stellatus]VFT96030.1 Aste57867_19312 [Aphanomyces stellatus]
MPGSRHTHQLGHQEGQFASSATWTNLNSPRSPFEEAVTLDDDSADVYLHKDQMELNVFKTALEQFPMKSGSSTATFSRTAPTMARPCPPQEDIRVFPAVSLAIAHAGRIFVATTAAMRLPILKCTSTRDATRRIWTSLQCISPKEAWAMHFRTLIRRLKPAVSCSRSGTRARAVVWPPCDYKRPTSYVRT